MSAPVSFVCTSAPPVPEKNPRAGHDARDPIAASNPFARKGAALRRALIDAVTEADIQEIAAILLLEAKQGDLAAIKLGFGYVFGKQEPPPSPDTPDRHELETRKQRLVDHGEPSATISSRDIEVLAPLLTALPQVRGLKVHGFAQKLSKALAGPASAAPGPDPAVNKRLDGGPGACGP
jgi:hypothetical protein